eukprot:6192217-Pleurochrysis_carterae.AAC.1
MPATIIAAPTHLVEPLNSPAHARATWRAALARQAGADPSARLVPTHETGTRAAAVCARAFCVGATSFGRLCLKVASLPRARSYSRDLGLPLLGYVLLALARSLNRVLAPARALSSSPCSRPLGFVCVSTSIGALHTT